MNLDPETLHRERLAQRLNLQVVSLLFKVYLVVYYVMCIDLINVLKLLR